MSGPIVIPPELVQPMRDGYRFAAGDARRFFEAEVGPPAVGLDVSNMPDTVSMVLDLSADESAVFWVWWRGPLKRGLNAFAMPDPLVDGWAWLDDDGTPVLCSQDDVPAQISATWLAMFGRGSTPTEIPAGLRRRIAIELMVMP